LRPYSLVLSLYRNAVSDADAALWVLRGMPGLSELTVEGNPLMRDAATRHRLVHRIQSLASLDDEPLTNSDRELAAEFFRREGAAAETMTMSIDPSLDDDEGGGGGGGENLMLNKPPPDGKSGGGGSRWGLTYNARDVM
jgi:hypothetical protein